MLQIASFRICKFTFIILVVLICLNRAHADLNMTLVCSLSTNIQSSSVCRDEFDFGNEFSKRDVLQLNFCSKDDSHWCVLMQFGDIDVDNGKCKASGTKESCDDFKICEKFMSGIDGDSNCFDVENVNYTKNDRVQMTSMRIFCCRNDHYCNDDEQGFFGNWANCTQMTNIEWPPLDAKVVVAIADNADAAKLVPVDKATAKSGDFLNFLLLVIVAINVVFY